ncbi:MAG: hypothetical protein A4S09_04855 [Proteobacteria bacterium SG_bin7]|nr:MAG: hypothetical protein A4S09_04855 [Proteobacteria bacterium SG_bin7]
MTTRDEIAEQDIKVVFDIDDAANDLSLKYNLPKERVKRILDATVSLQTGKTICLHPYFGNAIHYLGLEKALVLFEDEQALSRLKEINLPIEADFFFSFEELNDFLSCLRQYFLDNREDFLKFGYSTEEFKGPTFLKYYLVGVLCSHYPDGTLFEGFEKISGKRLESTRARILGFKLALIDALRQAFQHLDADTFFKDVERAFRTNLSKDDIEFMEEIEDIQRKNYEKYCDKYDEQNEVIYFCGGNLTQLSIFLEEYFVEIQTQLKHKGRKALGPLVALDSKYQPQLKIQSYFEVFDTPSQEVIERFAQLCKLISSDNDSYLEVYSEKLHRFLKQGMKIKVELGEVLIEPKHAEEIKRRVKALIDEFDRLSALQIAIPEQVQYGFYKQGDFWQVIFDGQSKHLSDQIGFSYISHLLKHPQKDFDAIVLVGIYSETNKQDAGKGVFQSADSVEDHEPMRAKGSMQRLDVVADQKTLSTVKSELELISERLENGNYEGEDEHADLLDKKSKLEQYLKLNTFVGRAKRFSDDGEKARKSVSKAIADAKRKLKQELPELWRHLNDFLDTGRSCRYKGNLPWKLEP